MKEPKVGDKEFRVRNGFRGRLVLQVRVYGAVFRGKWITTDWQEWRDAKITDLRGSRLLERV